jgi:hypothetical protein
MVISIWITLRSISTSSSHRRKAPAMSDPMEILFTGSLLDTLEQVGAG